MMVMTGGKERTVEEYRQLLARADFRLNKVIPASPDLSIIEALPDQVLQNPLYLRMMLAAFPKLTLREGGGGPPISDVNPEVAPESPANRNILDFWLTSR